LRADLKRQPGRRMLEMSLKANAPTKAADLQKTLAATEYLAGMHPVHAAYTYTQNQVSVMSEQLTQLRALAPLVNILGPAEDTYMPSGPPMSPLTVSYYTCWAFFDACAGPARETIGTLLLEVGAEWGMHPELLQLVGLMQKSRMGVFHHEGTDAGLAILRDLATDSVVRCLVPAGYLGEAGQIWYARVLPPPFPGTTEHLVFTTPYIILQGRREEWLAYFQRVCTQTSPQARIDECERHLKYGPSIHYWNEYVFEGYVNCRHEAIFLAGFPDVPESRPCSDSYVPRGR
jgi:hypothetical protein